ncbi:hypothetical protein XENOCAPTIV_009425 [Xenoophorus captivus]|uniref:Uncharacterized protein n=1 Tax=Xenoophorus captivus TaxID=1517983 RepID=A0ABV0S269_9TELE
MSLINMASMSMKSLSWSSAALRHVVFTEATFTSTMSQFTCSSAGQIGHGDERGENDTGRVVNISVWTVGHGPGGFTQPNSNPLLSPHEIKTEDNPAVQRKRERAGNKQPGLLMMEDRAQIAALLPGGAQLRHLKGNAAFFKFQMRKCVYLEEKRKMNVPRVMLTIFVMSHSVYREVCSRFLQPDDKTLDHGGALKINAPVSGAERPHNWTGCLQGSGFV